MAIILFIIVLGVLILVHEFGHYLAAKKSNTRVDEFGIGYPPRAVSLFKRGETTFTLNWIPFGGFVKIFGENPVAEEEGAGSERSFQNKPTWIQAMILSAGVIFNLLFAWLLFIIIFSVGTPMALESAPTGAQVSDRSVVVADVREESPAATAGIQTGDHVVELAAQTQTVAVDEAHDIQTFIAENAGTSLSVTIQRDGTQHDVLVLPTTDDGEARIGVGLVDTGRVRLAPHRAFISGLTYTSVLTKDIVIALGTLIGDAFQGEGDLDALTGPVGIVGVVGDAASDGLVRVLMLTALISVNLAVINLLPIPALDGGRLLFLLIEWIKGTPIPPKVFGWANAIGFSLLMILMIIVTVNDVLRLF